MLNPAILWRYLFGRHSPNQYLFRRAHLKAFRDNDLDVDSRYFYWRLPGVRNAVLGTCLGIVLVKKTICHSTSWSTVPVAIEVPPKTRYSVIYRAELSEKLPVSQAKEFDIAHVTNLGTCMRYVPAYARSFGLFEAARFILKLLFGRRWFFCAISDGQIAAFVWLYKFQEYLYPIEPGDCTVGVVSTSTFYRRRGLATLLMRVALNHAYDKGHRNFFIETAADNDGMLGAINNVGIWRRVGVFLRLGPRFR